MKSKLTVTIDSELVPRARRYARSRGISLSALIELSLRELTSSPQSRSLLAGEASSRPPTSTTHAINVPRKSTCDPPRYLRLPSWIVSRTHPVVPPSLGTLSPTSAAWPRVNPGDPTPQSSSPIRPRSYTYRQRIQRRCDTRFRCQSQTSKTLCRWPPPAPATRLTSSPETSETTASPPIPATSPQDTLSGPPGLSPQP